MIASVGLFEYFTVLTKTQFKRCSVQPKFALLCCVSQGSVLSVGPIYTYKDGELTEYCCNAAVLPYN